MVISRGPPAYLTEIILGMMVLSIEKRFDIGLSHGELLRKRDNQITKQSDDRDAQLLSLVRNPATLDGIG
jgi:hypothetical protein